MAIELIKMEHKLELLNFIKNIDSIALTTFRHWGQNFKPELITNRIIEDNLTGKEIGWVYVSSGNVGGYQHLRFSHKYRNDVAIHGFIINSENRGKGLGSQFEKMLIEEATKRSLYKIVALIDDNNLPSLHLDLKHNFCLAGVFFNEEKNNDNSRNMVYLERPIMLRSSQDDYLKLLKKFFSAYNLSPTTRNPSVRNDNLEMVSFSKKEFMAISDDCNFSNNIFKNDRFLSVKNIKNGIPDNVSNILCIFTKNKNITCFGFLEYFDLLEKQHVARIHIKPIENESHDVFHLLISGLLQILENNKIEKIWINIPETCSALITTLVLHGFIVEAIAFGDMIIDSRQINMISLAYHVKSKITFDYQLHFINELINKYS